MSKTEPKPFPFFMSSYRDISSSELETGQDVKNKIPVQSKARSISQLLLPEYVKGADENLVDKEKPTRTERPRTWWWN